MHTSSNSGNFIHFHIPTILIEKITYFCKTGVGRGLENACLKISQMEMILGEYKNIEDK